MTSFSATPRPRQRILIAGCGYVGTALALELCADGHEVWGLRRNIDTMPPAIQALSLDLMDERALRQALPGNIDVIVYAAAAKRRDDDAYRAIYIDGMRRLLDVASASSPKLERVLFTSSTAVYGQHDGEWVDEDSLTSPASFSGQRLLEAEALVAALPIRGVVLRLAGIYGPGRTRLVSRVDEGKCAPKSPVRYTNRIHRSDCAGALRHLIALRDPAPVYIGVDHAPAPLWDVQRFVAERLDPPKKDSTSPLESGARGANKRCSNRKLVNSGYRFRIPSFREGYPGIVNEYKQMRECSQSHPRPKVE